MVEKKHEIKTCPRCQQPFQCKINDIANCQCQGIVVGGDAWEFISNLYADCLCKTCLSKMNEKYGDLK